ncbi:glycosyltransferase family 4 protein [Metallosphaera tengchongensis]|uniref:Glycosyltransferase family 4 protein n=1 Tax=Metallosphaera tengchongensis TaxID=1532350 RepID=A0A6N0NVE6_9CREN|nr:glycosyltransferase family 4 protein [Metallosphaera tengchongensis]QKR00854.1 glycosyltransferase family 4 protein [Metallosphaera tengchongensis]
MKILILLRILWTAGAQRIAINEYKTLKELGHEVKIVFLRNSKTKGYEELLKGVDYTVIRNGSGLLTPFFFLATKLFAPDRGSESVVDLDLIRMVPKIVKKEGADYLICHDQWAGLGCYYAKRELGIPYSVFIHEKLSNYNIPILGKLANNLEKDALYNADKVLAVTEKVANSVKEKYSLNVEVNYPGMELLDCEPLSRRENIILSVSFWDSGRKPELYLNIAERFEKYKLVLAGNWRISSLKQDIINEIKRRGLTDRVFLRDNLKESELAELYRKSKFFLRFGFGEYGLATGVIEALGHCLPVIINDQLGTAYMVRENNIGKVLSNIDADEIKAFVENMKENEYTELQSNIREVILKYSWESHVKKLLP